MDPLSTTRSKERKGVPSCLKPPVWLSYAYDGGGLDATKKKKNAGVCLSIFQNPTCTSPKKSNSLKKKKKFNPRHAHASSPPHDIHPHLASPVPQDPLPPTLALPVAPEAFHLGWICGCHGAGLHTRLGEGKDCESLSANATATASPLLAPYLSLSLSLFLSRSPVHTSAWMTHRRRRRQIREGRQWWRRGGLDVVIVLPTGEVIENRFC